MEMFIQTFILSTIAQPNKAGSRGWDGAFSVKENLFGFILPKQANTTISKLKITEKCISLGIHGSYKEHYSTTSLKTMHNPSVNCICNAGSVIAKSFKLAEHKQGKF